MVDPGGKQWWSASAVLKHLQQTTQAASCCRLQGATAAHSWIQLVVVDITTSTTLHGTASNAEPVTIKWEQFLAGCSDA